MVRLSEISISRDQHLIDTLRSDNAFASVELHNRMQTESSNFSIRPSKLYTLDILDSLLSEAISLRRLVATEFPQDSQPVLALSHVIFYLQSDHDA